MILLDFEKGTYNTTPIFSCTLYENGLLNTHLLIIIYIYFLSIKIEYDFKFLYLKQEKI